MDNYFDKEIQIRITATSDQNGGYTLHKDGKPAMCALVPPIVMPTQLGGIGMTRIPCNTQCDLANIYEATDFNGKKVGIYSVACGKEIINYKLESNEDAPGKDSLLVRL